MKILFLNNGRPANFNPITVSAGATDAGKVFQTDASGKIDITFLPNNIGPDAVSIVASEALVAGDFVNIYSNAGVANVRKAIATSDNMRAYGYVQAAVVSLASATVFFDDTNAAQSGMVAGPQWLSDTVAGKTVGTPPSAVGTISQEIGVAVSATSVHVRFGEAYTN